MLKRLLKKLHKKETNKEEQLLRSRSWSISSCDFGAMFCFLAVLCYLAGAHMAIAVPWVLAVSGLATYSATKSGLLNRLAVGLITYHRLNGSFSGLNFDDLFQGEFSREFVVDLAPEEALQMALNGLNKLKLGSHLNVDWAGGKLRARASVYGSVATLADISVSVCSVGLNRTQVTVRSRSWTESCWLNTGNIEGVLLIEKAIREGDVSSPINLKKWRQRLLPGIGQSAFRFVPILSLLGITLFFMTAGQESQLQTRAQLYYQAGEYQKAFDTLDTLKGAARSDSQTIKAMALLHLNRGKEAQELLSQFIADDKESSSQEKIKSILANVYAANNEPDKANELIEEIRATAGYSANSRSNFVRGLMQEREGDFEGARFAYSTALVYDTGAMNRDYYEGLLSTNRQLKNFKEAADNERMLTSLTEESKTTPGADDAWLLIAEVLGGLFFANQFRVIVSSLARKRSQDDVAPVSAAEMPVFFDQEDAFDVSGNLDECFDRCLQVIGSSSDLRVSSIGTEDDARIEVCRADGAQSMILKLESVNDGETRLVIKSRNGEEEELEGIKSKLRTT